MITDWRIFALGSAFFAALTAILGKSGVSEMNSNMATLVRVAVILLFTAGLVSWRQEWQAPQGLPWKSLLLLSASGLATGLSWLCYYRALQLGPVSRVAPLDKCSVVLVILFAVLFLGEQLTMKAAVGGLLIAAGSILLAL